MTSPLQPSIRVNKLLVYLLQRNIGLLIRREKSNEKSPVNANGMSFERKSLLNSTSSDSALFALFWDASDFF